MKQKVKYGLSVMLSILLLSSTISVQAADSKLEETSLLSGTVTSSDDASRGSGAEYDAFIATCKNVDADYLKVTFTIEDASVLQPWTSLINFMPYTSSWGGWQSNMISLQDCNFKNGEYTAYISVDRIKKSCTDGDVAGINVCYVENADTAITLTGFYSCVGELADNGEKSILASTATSSKDPSRGTGAEYENYIASFYDWAEYDYLKITYTIDDTSKIQSWSNLFNFMPYNDSWGGWDSNIVSIDNSVLKDGEYTFCITIKDIEKSLSEGSLYGINLCYELADADVTLTGYYACKGDLPDGFVDGSSDKSEVMKKEIPDTASNNYVEAMGQGWNLGNTFDAYDSNINSEDFGENAWGNPTVTKELIKAIKAKGFKSIRMPMTVFRRYTENNGQYTINPDWLARYKEVVDWAVDEGLYVMINMHHDSTSWLLHWDGNKNSKEYIMYTQFYKQIAEYFADEPEQVCFETINEPRFQATGSISEFDKLEMINRAAYDIVRATGGKNATRMIVIPTYLHSQEYSSDLATLIESLNDENVIATIHYYSEWCFSGNLGTTGFDDPINGGEDTARELGNTIFEKIYNKFTAKGVGVIVGEYGLLGHDSGDECNETGEELKYLEYINEVARQDGFCMMFWDNGSYIDRNDTVNYAWRDARIGTMVETSMNERSSTADCLDILYFDKEATADTLIPLRINGPEFKGIEGLTEGKDYTYDKETTTISLKASYVNAEFAKMDADEYGNFADVVIQFTSGADWHEYLCKFGQVTTGEATGTAASIKIPVTYNGTKVRRVSAYQRSGSVGPDHTWCKYLQFGQAFAPDYVNGNITLKNLILGDGSLKDGSVLVKVEMWDGQVATIWLDKNGSSFKAGSQYSDNLDAHISVAPQICVYAGETEIPSDYLDIPEGASVYGIWSADNKVATMVGWPATIVFGTTPQPNFVDGGVAVHYYDRVENINLKFGVKAKPEVEDMLFEPGTSNFQYVSLKNATNDAVLSNLCVDDENVVFNLLGENNKLNATGEGTTHFTVDVTQYGRTVKVKGLATVMAGVSTTSEPNTSAPTTKVPVTTVPPSSQVPVTEVPVTEVPVTTAPVTETPNTSSDPIYPPTLNPTDIPVTDVPVDSVPYVKVDTTVGTTISQVYTIKSGAKDCNLKDLSIRFYYEKDGNKDQDFWVDNAAISYNCAPWYVNYTSSVKVSVTDKYIDISFDTSQMIGLGTLSLQTRMNQSDWSPYQGFKAGKTEIYCNGNLASIIE